MSVILENEKTQSKEEKKDKDKEHKDSSIVSSIYLVLLIYIIQSLGEYLPRIILYGDIGDKSEIIVSFSIRLLILLVIILLKNYYPLISLRSASRVGVIIGGGFISFLIISLYKSLDSHENDPRLKTLFLILLLIIIVGLLIIRVFNNKNKNESDLKISNTLTNITYFVGAFSFVFLLYLFWENPIEITFHYWDIFSLIAISSLLIYFLKYNN